MYNAHMLRKSQRCEQSPGGQTDCVSEWPTD